MTIHYAIGDIHGMDDHLEQMLNEILKLVPGVIVTLGDYIDRGPKSKQVIDRLMAFKEPGWEMVNLMGNHEDMAIPPRMISTWLMNGGQETLDSFDGAVPESYFKWMDACRTEYECDDYIFVHAGLEPGHDIYTTSRQSKLWIRTEFLDSEFDWGKLIIHGHTPRKTIEERPNRINIDTGACFDNHGYGTLTCAILPPGREGIKYIQVRDRFENHPGFINDNERWDITTIPSVRWP